MRHSLQGFHTLPVMRHGTGLACQNAPGVDIQDFLWLTAPGGGLGLWMAWGLGACGLGECVAWGLPRGGLGVVSRLLRADDGGPHLGSSGFFVNAFQEGLDIAYPPAGEVIACFNGGG